MTQDMTIPKDVQSWMQELRDVGLEPDAAREGDQWVVSVTTEHAEMRLELARSGDGRWKWADSTLTVDGQLRDRAHNARDLAGIIRRANGEHGPDKPFPMLPECSPSGGPPYVQREYYSLARRLGDLALLGSDGKRWMLGFDAEGVSLRMRFGRYKRGQWYYKLQIVIDGWDRSDEVDGGLAGAMALISPAALPDAPKSTAVPGGPVRPTPKETRKGTVMRN